MSLADVVSILLRLLDLVSEGGGVVPGSGDGSNWWPMPPCSDMVAA